MAAFPDRSAAAEPEQTDVDTLRDALSRFSSGVTVVTAGGDTRIEGMTVQAFTSVSLEPPQVLVVMTADKPATRLILETGRFAVNILAEHQAHLSQQFAYVEPPQRFDGVSWEPGRSGAPLLAGALAGLECRVAATQQAGDHLIIVGEVNAIQWREGRPLLYTQRGYWQLGERIEPAG